MITPGDEFSGSINAALEVMKSSGAIVIVMKIVFACPEKFDGHSNFFSDGRGLEHVVIGEAPAESATGALQMHNDVVVRNV